MLLIEVNEAGTLLSIGPFGNHRARFNCFRMCLDTKWIGYATVRRMNCNANSTDLRSKLHSGSWYFARPPLLMSNCIQTFDRPDRKRTQNWLLMYSCAISTCIPRVLTILIFNLVQNNGGLMQQFQADKTDRRPVRGLLSTGNVWISEADRNNTYKNCRPRIHIRLLYHLLKRFFGLDDLSI